MVLNTVNNDWWGIRADQSVRLTISYLGRLQEWEARLSDDMKSLLIPINHGEDIERDVDTG